MNIWNNILIFLPLQQSQDFHPIFFSEKVKGMKVHTLENIQQITDSHVFLDISLYVTYLHVISR